MARSCKKSSPGLYEAKSFMKTVRCQIGRIDVDFAANHTVISILRCQFQIAVHFTCNALAACVSGDDNSIDIDEPSVFPAKPLEVEVLMSGILIQRDAESVHLPGNADIEA